MSSLDNDKSIIDNPADEIDSSSFFDEWNIKKYKESLESLKFYYNSKQPNKLSEKENIKIDNSLELLIFKINNYIISII